MKVFSWGSCVDHIFLMFLEQLFQNCRHCLSFDRRPAHQRWRSKVLNLGLQLVNLVNELPDVLQNLHGQNQPRHCHKTNNTNHHVKEIHFKPLWINPFLNNTMAESTQVHFSQWFLLTISCCNYESKVGKQTFFSQALCIASHQDKPSEFERKPLYIAHPWCIAPASCAEHPSCTPHIVQTASVHTSLSQWRRWITHWSTSLKTSVHFVRCSPPHRSYSVLWI